MTPNMPNPELVAICKARRQRLLDRMQAAGGGIAVLPTAPERTRSRDTLYPYRPDSYFYYLTGFTEPEAALVLIAADTPRQILFCREKNEERETWEGYRFGPDAAREIFGFDEAHTFGDLQGRLPELLLDRPRLWSMLGQEHAWDKTLIESLNTVQTNARAGASAPAALLDLRTELDEMRLFKDEYEISTMRRAGRISVEAHRRAMQATKPERFEYQIEAELLHTFRTHGSSFPAYPSIVASGPNTCVLHYIENSRRMEDGDLLLIDAGCELDGYASDITSTFPVSGRFSGPQRDIYTLVLAAQHTAAQAIVPGADWNAPHDAAVRVLAQGMLDLGLLDGSLDAVLEKGDYRRFYMHRTGHWLGMDVHDAGSYTLDQTWRPLQPGMVFTLEPGCYIRPDATIPEVFWNIGVRIEDNVLVTADGYECLTEGVPRTIADIEAWMRADR